MNGSLKSFFIIAVGIILLATLLAFTFSVIVALFPIIVVIVAILAIMNLVARHRAEKAVQNFFEEAEKQATQNTSSDDDVIDVEAKEIKNK